MLYYLKVILLMISFGSFTFLNAHTYAIERGIVLYDIEGGGVLTEETNLTLKGKATLDFEEWGRIQIVEEKGVVITNGALESKKNILSLEKQTKKALFTVDYKNKKIQKRKNSISTSSQEHDIRGLEVAGQETVAGLLCDIWQGKGVKKCIYKGLALKIELDFLGISYRKVAIDINFDLNGSSDKCTIPNYPTEKFALFNSNAKTKNRAKAECFRDVLKNIAYSTNKKTVESNNSTISKKQKIEFLNKIGQKIYQSQKGILPELLMNMKATRECLQSVDKPFDTDKCVVYFNRLKEKIGSDENDFIILWDNQKKSILLDKIEDFIYDLQSRLPCIERAKNVTDLSACMR